MSQNNPTPTASGKAQINSDGSVTDGLFTVTTQDGITEMWQFLNATFPDTSVVYQQENGVPLPASPTIVMNTVSTRRLSFNTHKLQNFGDGSVATIIEQVEVVLQVEFFGSGAQRRMATFRTLWQDAYAFDWFVNNGKQSRPLYERGGTQQMFINESDGYEQRWICDVTLQVAQSVSYTTQTAINPGKIGLNEVDQ